MWSTALKQRLLTHAPNAVLVDFLNSSDADGSVRLLGRGSTSINTGGEKVYPEEVEQALKTHPAVRDAVVVGVPHERFGQAVTAAVGLVDGARDVNAKELTDHVGGQLERYRAPRHVIFVDSVGRSSSGKADYKGVSGRVNEALSAAGGGGPDH